MPIPAQPESRKGFPGAKEWAKTQVTRACLQCEDHGLWWKGAWAHKWHVPNFTSHAEAGSRAAGNLLCHIPITAGPYHQRSSTSVQHMSDIQGSHETRFSMSSQRSIRSGFADPSVIWHHHIADTDQPCVYFLCLGLGSTVLLTSSAPWHCSLCHERCVSDITSLGWFGMAVLRLPPPPAKPGSVHPRTDCSGRLSSEEGECEEEGCRAAGYTASLSTSELACFSL